jgi:aryl-alcohol dehydrogenase-like predicted oxidoreductase
VIPTLQLQQDNDTHHLSRFWLGTWALSGFRYGKTSHDDAVAVIETALEMGINVFDTSPFYGKGLSDRLIYPYKDHHDIFICTKIGLRWEGNTVRHAASPRELREDTLNILGTHKLDTLDLLLLHWPDPNCDIADSFDTLESLKQEGLIKDWGASNLSTEHIITFADTSATLLQQRSSLFHPFVRSSHVTGLTCGYSPFEQGLLLTPEKDTQIGKKDIRNRNPYFNSSSHHEWRRLFFECCDKLHIDPGILSFIWPFYRDQVDITLFGARSPEQLQLLSDTIAFTKECGLSFSDTSNWDTLLASRCGTTLWEHLHRVPEPLTFH